MPFCLKLGQVSALVRKRAWSQSPVDTLPARPLRVSPFLQECSDPHKGARDESLPTDLR